MKRIMSCLAAVLLCFLCVSCGIQADIASLDMDLPVSSTAEKTTVQIRRISISGAEPLYLRTGPGKSYNRKRTEAGESIRLYNGAEVTVVSRAGAWGCVRYKGVSGWIDLRETTIVRDVSEA